MATKTDISNLALGRVGAQRIMDINDAENKSARLCKLFFDDTVREVGRSGEWNCLKSRDTFGRLVTDPSFGWAYQYQLPVDCLRVIKVNGTTMTVTTDYTISATGLVTFTSPPTTGQAITWTGEFDLPMRFATDEFPAVINEAGLVQIGSIPIIELVGSDEVA